MIREPISFTDSRVLDEVVQDAANQILERVAEKAASIIRSNISTPGPEPSQPGEYPHMQSGDLHDGIAVENTGDEVAVVSESGHSAHVEEIRPFMQRSIITHLADLEEEVKEAASGS